MLFSDMWLVFQLYPQYMRSILTFYKLWKREESWSRIELRSFCLAACCLTTRPNWLTLQQKPYIYIWNVLLHDWCFHHIHKLCSVFSSTHFFFIFFLVYVIVGFCCCCCCCQTWGMNLLLNVLLFLVTDTVLCLVFCFVFCHDDK